MRSLLPIKLMRLDLLILKIGVFNKKVEKIRQTGSEDILIMNKKQCPIYNYDLYNIF